LNATPRPLSTARALIKEPKEEMMSRYSFLKFIILAVAISSLLIAGCTATTGTTRLYVLQSLSTTEAEMETKRIDEPVAIGIGSIEFPEYLDRPQIVTRTSESELHLAEFNQWAVPLKDDFSRALAEDLSVLLFTDNIFIFPWKRSTVIDYHVTMKITRFDTDTKGESMLVANWSVLKGDDKTELLSRKSVLKEQTDGQDYKAIVSAMSRNLNGLSLEIAKTIEEGLK
jgi:hypothetical protein